MMGEGEVGFHSSLVLGISFYLLPSGLDGTEYEVIDFLFD